MGRESRVGGEVMGERGIGVVMLPMIATPKPCVLWAYDVVRS